MLFCNWLWELLCKWNTIIHLKIIIPFGGTCIGIWGDTCTVPILPPPPTPPRECITSSLLELTWQPHLQADQKNNQTDDHSSNVLRAPHQVKVYCHWNTRGNRRVSTPLGANLGETLLEKNMQLFLHFPQERVQHVKNKLQIPVVHSFWFPCLWVAFSTPDCRNWGFPKWRFHSPSWNHQVPFQSSCRKT